MSIIGALSRHNHFSEFGTPIYGPTGWLSAAQRKALCLTALGLTATAAQINAVGTGVLAPVLVTDAAAYSVLAADSGKLHILPDFTASCTFTLPTGAAGLCFEFVSNAILADAQNWVFTSPAGVFYRGGVVFLDNDAGAGADEITSVFPNGSSHVTLTIVTPNAGTRILVFWDGTRYVVNGVVHSATTPAFS